MKSANLWIASALSSNSRRKITFETAVQQLRRPGEQKNRADAGQINKIDFR